MGKGRKIKDLRTFGTDFKRKNEDFGFDAEVKGLYLLM